RGPRSIAGREWCQRFRRVLAGWVGRRWRHYGGKDFEEIKNNGNWMCNTMNTIMRANMEAPLSVSMASQAHHKSVAPQGTCAPRNVVPAQSRGESDSCPTCSNS